MLIFLVLIQAAFAKESWYCTEESSKVVGAAVHACGIGIGKDENAARAKAFQNAQDEFNRICKASSTCSGHAVTVEPKRTTCEPMHGNIICHRMVVFNVSSQTIEEAKLDAEIPECAGNLKYTSLLCLMKQDERTMRQFR